MIGLMTTYQPATLHSDSIARPACEECGTKVRLFGIEPERPGFELWSFECPKCHHILVQVGKAAEGPWWPTAAANAPAGSGTSQRLGFAIAATIQTDPLSYAGLVQAVGLQQTDPKCSLAL